MEIFNYALTVLFLGAAVWMGKKVLEQRKQIEIFCRYLNAYRIFIIICFVMSAGLMVVGLTDVFDFIRSLAMTVMVGLFLCLREGAGETGFVCNGTLIPYSSVSHYDYKNDGKNLIVYVIFREKDKNGVEESSYSLKFKAENQKTVLDYLEKYLPKKHKRIKKD